MNSAAPLRPDELELLNLYNLLDELNKGRALGNLLTQLESLLSAQRLPHRVIHLDRIAE